MRKHRQGLATIGVYVLTLFLIFGFMGCATTGTVGPPSTKPDALKNPFVIDAYKQLFAVAQTYNAAWLTFKDLHAVGVITDADFEAGRTIARQYRTAHIDAVDALIRVEKGVYGQDQAQIILSLAMIANKQILAYLGPRIQKK